MTIPSSTVTLTIDADGDIFQEYWECATVVGMLTYLAQKFRPDIAYVIYQRTRLIHTPRKSHTVGIKRILRYLQGTKGKRLILNPSTKLQVDCYVDADFSELWNVEPYQISYA